VAQPLAVAILVAHLVLGILYSVAVPMWEASDETGHFAFVKYLASERRFPPPVQDVTQWFDESHQPPLYYILAALTTSWIDTGDGLEPEVNPHAFTGKGMGGVNVAVHSDREAFPYRGTALAMHVARLVSVLISTAVVAVTYLIGRLLCPHDEAVALGAMALNAFWPQFLFLGSVVTNDILVVLVSSLVIFFLLRIAYGGRGIVDFLALGFSLLAAMGTKMSAWVLVPFALGVLILMGIRRAPTRARWWFVPLLWICCSGVWWFLRGTSLPQNWFVGMPYSSLIRDGFAFIQHPLRQAVGWHWDILPHALRYCSRTIWASFGWDNIGVEEWVYQIPLLLSLAALPGLIVFTARRKNSRRFGVVILLLGLLSLFAVPVYKNLLTGGPFLYGRIVASTIPMFSLLLALGLARFVPQRHRRNLSIVLAGGMFALGLLMPFRYIVPAYARPPILSADDLQYIEHPLHTNFDDKMELLGYDIDPDKAKTREGVVVTLYWRALSETEENYTIGVHLLGPEYESYGGRDSYPAQGNYATSLWKEGDVIRDTYWLRIPRSFPAPSQGSVEVTVYLHDTGERLPIVNPRGETKADSILLGPFGVTTREEPEYSIRYPLRYNLGNEVLLLGYDAPDTIGPTLPLTLYWQGVAEMEEDYTVFVHVFDEEGNLLGQHDSQPGRGNYPTSLWTEGWIVEDRHSVILSTDLSRRPLKFRLAVGMYLLETMERLPVTDEVGTRVRHDEVVIQHELRILDQNRIYVPIARADRSS